MIHLCTDPPPLSKWEQTPTRSHSQPLLLVWCQASTHKQHKNDARKRGMRLFLMLVCVFFIFGVIVLTLFQPKLPPEVNRILYVRYMISLFGLPVTFAETSHSKYQPKKCMIYLASLAPLDRFVLVLAQRQKGQRILCMKTSMTRRTLVKSFLGSMLQEGIAI